MENTACCSCSPVVETRFSGNRGRSPSYAIIEAVAAADGIAPIELDSIYNDIDPEALDTLLEDQNNESVCIRITINGWNGHSYENPAPTNSISQTIIVRVS